MPDGYWQRDDSSWRSQPRAKDWKRTRQRIIARDAGVCQWPTDAQGTARCGAPGTDVDHIVPVFMAKTEAELELLERDSNLRLLCGPHHRHKTASDAGRASQAKRPKRKRDPEPHPGLINPNR
ncbi:HNH endonuclease [Spirillospora sp. CA-128828]|uniref:HNH endonuclease n=1 Tax=Spirillospora sp. CA-128828 TaxID=3240033 RepID=UPI003D89E147